MVAGATGCSPSKPAAAWGRKRLFGAVLLLLGACGGNVETPPPAAAESPSAPPPADERPVIVAFGDSLTAGHGVPAGAGYPDFLQRELDERGLEYRVVNEGVSGETTAQGLIRSGIVLARKPRWVIVCYGANDGLRGLSTEKMEANLRTIVGRFLEANVNVLLAGMRLPPNYGSEYVGMFEAVFPKLAAELGVPFIPFLLEGVAGRPELNQADGIHPNVQGNRMVAAHVANFFEKAVAGEAARR